MQARVTCPACQTTLRVPTVQGDGTLLRCPHCRHEFVIRLRPQSPPPARPVNDPLAAPLQGLPSHPSYRPPQASWPGHAAPPPAWPQDGQSGSSGSLLWIGIGAGAAVAIVGLVLTLIAVRMTAPRDNTIAPAAIAGAAPQAAPAPAAAAPGAPSPVGAAPATAAPAQSVMPPNVASAPMTGQPVSTLTPSSPLSPSIPPAALPPAQAPVGAALSYRFNGGEEYVYTFSVKADIAGTAAQSNGTCTLRLSREASPPEFAAQQKTGQGNGSGFLITSDGYVVTCAHVVEDTTKIEVVLGAQTYPAQVAAYDKEHDLAVVRINAANLPTISLANSDAVEQAQEVRAVGFPLSNVLGESVKITRGTVAGIVNTSGRKLLQVDASINPGNSGGPLVNEMGQVVGVASAKLAGEDVDGVGFAVPANEVMNLLRSKGINPAPAATAQKLDGPSLARRVTPAVALIKVTTGPGGYGSANRLVLDYNGHVTSPGAPRVVGRMRMPGFPNIESENGKLLISERGEVLETTGNVQLPYLLGHVGALAIEPLGEGEQRNWHTQRATVLTQIIGEESPSPMSMRFRHRSRFGQSPFASQTKIVVTPAIETCNYAWTGTSGNLVMITKQYTFQTLDQAGAPPVAKVNGEGTITFNRANGCAEKMDYRATLVRSVNNVSVTVPLTMEWHRLTAAELEQFRAQAKANQEAAKKAHEERMAQESKNLVGEDTEFVGGDGGGRAKRYVEEDSLLYGVECRYSEWMHERCVNEILPVFSRDQKRTMPAGAVAREGYAVGAVNVSAGKYVNGIQLIFMRVRDDGRLDPGDSYTSNWLGVRGKGKPQKLTGQGAPIIGFSVKRGLVVDAMALIFDPNKQPEADNSDQTEKPGKSKTSAAADGKRAASG